MNEEKKSRPSFSTARRWKIGLEVVLRTALVLAVALMANFLAAKFGHRFYLSSQTNAQLSTRTLSVLHSLTNQVTAILYYDTSDENNFYPTIRDLLEQYRAVNKNISVRTVDYLRDAGEAEKLKEKYNLAGPTENPGAPPDKDLIIFDTGGRFIVKPGEAIVQKKLEIGPSEDPKQKFEGHYKPIFFNGEILFTSMLLAMQNPHPLKAYFLQGDGEGSLADTSTYGFSKLALTLAQNYIAPQNLELSGDNQIPADCNLLVITPPKNPLSESEIEKISKYLADGGKLFAFFNYGSINNPTGLEPVLQKWGVNVFPDFVKDLNSSTDDLVVRNFSSHPVVNPLAQLGLQMIRPLCIAKVQWKNAPANAPQVDELAFSSDNSVLSGDMTAAPRRYSVAAAVEQKPIAGISNPRGNTRIVVVGDSLFVGNYIIDAGGNRDFIGSAANWLVDRQEMLSGIGPRPVTEFRLMLTQKQQLQLRWLLIGALPGGVLIFGWLVWLVRRK